MVNIEWLEILRSMKTECNVAELHSSDHTDGQANQTVCTVKLKEQDEQMQVCIREKIQTSGSFCAASAHIDKCPIQYLALLYYDEMMHQL